MRTKFGLAVAGIGLLMSAQPSVAHHSFAAEFDAAKPFSFTGTVTKVLWTNPHAFLYVDVVDEQTREVTNWAMEMSGPNALLRMGWNRNSVKVGDVVELEGSRAKNGSPLGNVRSVIHKATGKRLFSNSSENETP